MTQRAANVEKINAEFDDFRKTLAPGEAVHDTHGFEQCQQQREGFKLNRIPAAELASTTFDVRFHVRGILPMLQPGGWFGGKKVLKTNMVTDLAISLQTGDKFLGYFDVEQPARVAFFSGESGMATIQETANRICASKGIELADTGIIFSDTLPIFGNLEHMAALEEFLLADEIGLAIFDPAYLCMMTDGREGSLFAMGAILRHVSTLCNRIGCTPLILHHMRKSVADPYTPGDLDDASWAGFAEFCRHWTLINRREKYEPGSGLHRLWLSVGGSMGHSGLWGVDIFEGVYTGPGSRVWEVEVLKADDCRQQADHATSQAKQDRQDEKVDQLETEIVRAAGKLPGQQGTMSDIRAATGRNGQLFALAFGKLVQAGELKPVTLSKGNNRTYEGFRLSNEQE